MFYKIWKHEHYRDIFWEENTFEGYLTFADYSTEKFFIHVHSSDKGIF